jgi:hypothetical protein
MLVLLARPLERLWPTCVSGIIALYDVTERFSLESMSNGKSFGK